MNSIAKLLTTNSANIAPKSLEQIPTSSEEILEYEALIWEEKQDYFHLRYSY